MQRAGNCFRYGDSLCIYTHVYIYMYTWRRVRSFDYYNRSRSLATTFSFRKWFPPDGSRQSERISAWFPGAVRPRTFAFHCVATRTAPLRRSPPALLSRTRLSKTRRGNFVRKTNTRSLIRPNSQAAGRFFLRPSSFFAMSPSRRENTEAVLQMREVIPSRYPKSGCETFQFIRAERTYPS